MPGKRKHEDRAKGTPHTTMESTSPENVQVPIVFIHGIKGSKLVDPKTGKVEYGSTGQLLNFEDGYMEMPHKFDEHGVQVHDGLVPGELLGPVKLWGLTVANAQGPFLAFAEDKAKKRGTKFHKYIYDWRRPVPEHAANFEKWLLDLCTTHKYVYGVQLVAHSLGAVISLDVLNNQPQLFHSIAWVAPGFGTGISFLEDSSLMGKYSKYRERNNTGFNSTLITPRFWVGASSAHSFWPTKEHPHVSGSNGIAPLVEADGTAIQFDFYNLKDYKREKLMIYHPKAEVDVTPEMEEYLQTQLTRCYEYRKHLDTMKIHISKQPPQRMLISTCGVAPIQYMIDKTDTDDHVQWRTPKTVLGDGRLTVTQCSEPPCDLRVLEIVGSTNGHMQVLSDIPKMDVMLDKLYKDGEAHRLAKMHWPLSKRPKFK